MKVTTIDEAMVGITASDHILETLKELADKTDINLAMIILDGTCGRALAITGMDFDRFIGLVKSNLEHKVNDDVRAKRPS